MRGPKQLSKDPVALHLYQNLTASSCLFRLYTELFVVLVWFERTAYVCSREIILSWDAIYKQKFQKIKKNVCASAFNNYHATIILLKQFSTYFLFYFFINF